VPHHIKDHVDYITPGIRLLAPVDDSQQFKREDMIRVRRDNEKKSRSARVMHSLRTQADESIVETLLQSKNAEGKGSDLSTCDVAITPACVAALYKIPENKRKPHPNNSLAVFESELQFYLQEDLDLFFANFTKQIPKGTHPIAANIDGGQQATTDPYQAGGEVNLDLMLAYPIVYPQTIVDYEVDDFLVQSNPNDTYNMGGFNNFLNALDGVSLSQVLLALFASC
jgi:tripeptidyl-peptidase-1